MISKIVNAIIVISLIAVPVSGPAYAHHSFSMFDGSKATVLRGTVRQFRWTNPHSAIILQVDGRSGPGEVWSIEMTSPGNLRRLGWERTSLKAGDKVEITINPLRDGRRGGAFRSLTFLDTGKTLTARLLEVEAK